jgi:hypothetical protein
MYKEKPAEKQRANSLSLRPHRVETEGENQMCQSQTTIDSLLFLGEEKSELVGARK